MGYAAPEGPEGLVVLNQDQSQAVFSLIFSKESNSREWQRERLKARPFAQLKEEPKYAGLSRGHSRQRPRPEYFREGSFFPALVFVRAMDVMPPLLATAGYPKFVVSFSILWRNCREKKASSCQTTQCVF